jgi:hypothetical protein
LFITMADSDTTNRCTSTFHTRSLAVMARAGAPFLHRAHLYRQWDLQLCRQTRFFGAAALTNLVLAELFSRPAARMWLAPATQSFLLKAGKVLEALNHKVAQELARRSQDTRLDAQLVAIEQSALEYLLHSLRAADASAHAVTTSQLNRLLDLRTWGYLQALNLSPSAGVYERVLKRVRQELNRHIRFSLQSDREHIGRTVIALLPSHWACQLLSPRHGTSLRDAQRS